MRLNKYLKILLALLGLSAAGGVFVVEQVLPYAGIKPYRMIASEHRWRFPKGYLPDNYGLRGRPVVVHTPDGVALRGWFLKTDRDSARGTFILLHGIGNCKESEFERAKILADEGFNSIALDLRAHGESGGDYCTFGFYEKNDIVAVVDSVFRWTYGEPVGIWGASLGGAIALQSMALDKRIAWGVVESTFDEFEKVAEEYGADWMFGLRSRWVVHRVLEKSGRIARFDPASVKPVLAAASIDKPVLFIHGDHDEKIPIGFNRRNFEAVRSPDKQWITVAGGGHSNLWRVDGEGLSARVKAFLNSIH